MRTSLRALLVVVPLAGCEDVAPGPGGRGAATNTMLHVHITPWTGGQAPPTELDVVVIGRVVEIEPDVVAVAAYKEAPKEHWNDYKVAIVQVEDRVLGAAGVTRMRVGFLAEGARTSLTPGIAGCFCLARHPTSDFYVLVSRPTPKEDAQYPAELDRVKKVARAIGDPVAALQADNLTDRFEAALYLAFRYQWPRVSSERELIPEEENKAILDVLAEVPWGQVGAPPMPGPTDLPVPHREFLWHKFDLAAYGFERPAPDQPEAVGRAMMDEATSKFLKDNAGKIRLKRYVQK